MKTYDIENKINSTKWNAFFLNRDEVEEYLEDGIPAPSGLFSRFLNEKKENDSRRNKRMVELLSLRTIKNKKDWEEYSKHSEKDLDGEIVELIYGVEFSQKQLSYFRKVPDGSDPADVRLEKLIKEGSEESGNIIMSYPSSLYISNHPFQAVVFITTKGLCIISDSKESGVSTSPYAATMATGPIFGAIAAGVAAITAKYIEDSITKYNMDQEQKEITKLAYKYSPWLIAKSKIGWFIPYHMISALIYNIPFKKGESVMALYFENIKRIEFVIEDKVMKDLVEQLSGDNPPGIT